MSIGSEDEESSSSSIDHVDFKQTSNTSNAANIPRRHHHYHRSKDNNRFDGGNVSSASSSHQLSNNIQRFALGSRNRVTDTGNFIISIKIYRSIRLNLSYKTSLFAIFIISFLVLFLNFLIYQKRMD